ncbi:hypothetical protein OS493_015584 [Desmophyllum pertusum]|uniref:Uncharacterized protein n=1 Tax=Desmophyllum pertusum TaxID=174260 RepID=A0A9W9YP42_9CNID|nr:hypothetical protein OS493_015584 [Desmophyllum pertusum]
MAPAKVPKLLCPKSVYIHAGLFSVQSSTKDDRCFVHKEGSQCICLHSTCKDARAVYVSSGRSEEFSCQHINSTAESVGAQLVLDLTSEKVSSYPCDSPTRDSLLKLQIPGEFRAVYRVSDRSYVISVTNMVGFCHIKVKSSQQITTYNCGCKGFVSKRKQEKSHVICCHLHVLFCTLELSSTGGSKAGAENVDSSTTSESPSSSTAPSVTSSLIQASSSRVFTMELYSLFKLPYKLGHQLLRLINTKDALTYLGSNEGWPTSFEVVDSHCGVCGSPLGASKAHPGTRGACYIYSNLNVFKEVSINMQECSNSLCKAMHRLMPTEDGIYELFLFQN